MKLSKSNIDLYVISFLLLSPELSNSLLPFLDGSLILLFYLILSTKKIPINQAIWVLIIISLFTFFHTLQQLFQDYIPFEINVRRTSLRLNGTFGFLPNELNPDWGFLSKIFLKCILAFMIFLRIAKYGGKKFFKFYSRTLVIYLILQVCLYLSGQYETVTKALFYQKALLQDGNFIIHFRNGIPRFEAGFSEPSFLVSMTLIFLIFRGKGKLIKDLVFLFFLFLLTQSTSVLLLLCFVLFQQFSNRNLEGLMGLFFIGINFLFSTVLFRELIEEMNINPSFAFRLLQVFNIQDVTKINMWIGQGLFEIYTQPPLINIFLQIGLVGAFLFSMILISKKRLLPTIFFLCMVLLISPQFYFLGNILFFLLIMMPGYHLNPTERIETS